ncbi:tyrosine-type recombinase/integrase, partial [Pandoraea sputorum]|uniref:tyrosine-type recombinase/integrase n=1 Tax=Pandoraea sputorum TaxID=93222 RepID=UPI003555EE43
NVNVFSDRHSRKTMDMNQLSSFFKRLSRHSPERISPHRLRHTIATKLMRDPDRNIHTVKNIMGHQNIATTMKYVAVNQTQMRELINTIA